jgi:FAD/FMN-containing dehydrogenase
MAERGQTATPERIAPAIKRDLEPALSGPVIGPADAGYDDARAVYNGLHDRYPAVIVPCRVASDVAVGVRFAAEHDLDLAIRGGGHSGPGFGTVDDGIVLDLSPLRSVVVDAGEHIARAGGGCTVADVDGATHPHGLATTMGTVSSTGIAGLTLGGGFGHLTRKCGLTLDNLRSVEIVTAGGEILTADHETNFDLFWALRGGGGNFGVVTRFDYALHSVSEVIGGPIAFPAEAAPAVLRAYADLMDDAPDDLGGIMGLGQLPPFPFVSAEHHGTPGCIALVCWPGDPSDLDDVLAPLRAAAPALGDGLGPMPYPVLNTLFDELLPPGIKHYWKAAFTRELTDDAIDVHAAFMREWASPEGGTFFFPLGGAAARVAPDDTAFGYRDVQLNVVIAGSWSDPSLDDTMTPWVRLYHDALAPHSEIGAYTNFLSADDTDRVSASFGSNYERLRAIKATYDPDNVFHINHNIPPA